MYQASNEKQKTKYDGMNRTAKSRRNQNARRNGNQQILWDTGSRQYQTSRDERN